MEVYTPITVPDAFVPADYGLLTAVNWVTPTNGNWAVGVSYEANCTATNITVDPCIISGSPTVPEKAATWDRSERGSRPFTVLARADCAPVDDWLTTGREKVLKSLSDNSQYALERTLWTGYAFGTSALIFPNLTTVGPITDASGRIVLQPASSLVAGGPYDVVEGLNRLEAQIVACGYTGNGVIHVPVAVSNALVAQHLVYDRGGKLYTKTGHQVVIGRGYDTTISPSGPAVTGQAWMMATSPIFGIRGTPKTFDPMQSFDRSVNTLEFMAEQTFLLGWTCCRAGVLVSTGGEPAGLPNTST